MKPTQEQLAVINATERKIMVVAGAGSGKTSTLVQFALLRPRASFIYIAFNRAIKQEAEQKFPKNVKCVTSHSAAYASVGRFYREKLGALKAYHVAQAFDLGMTQAGIITNSLKRFYASSDNEISTLHVQQDIADPKDQEKAVELVKQVWGKAKDLADQSIPMDHDGYLKLAQLNGLQLNADYILFDEYQDANPVTKAIIEAQRAKVVYVGDKRQAIYGFRGAKDSMDSTPVDARYYLTHSFRFGQGIADLANAVLSAYSPHPYPIVGKGSHASIFAVDRSRPHTVLCRTNGLLLIEAITCMQSKIPFSFVGGAENYKFDNVLDAYWLKKGVRSSIKDKFIGSFPSFDEMALYAETLDDRELKFLAKCVKEYGDDLPTLVKQIVSQAKPIPDGNEVIMTTAHRSKGLEWDCVVLAEDFTDMCIQRDPVSGKEKEPDTEEVNLLYVALTRAMKGISIPVSLHDFLGSHSPALLAAIKKESQAANDCLRAFDGTASPALLKKEAEEAAVAREKLMKLGAACLEKPARDQILELIRVSESMGKVDPTGIARGVLLSIAKSMVEKSR